MIITQTPLRIRLAEDARSVLSSAIDKFVYVIVKERLDDKIYLNYSKKEIVDDVGSIDFDLAREALKQVGLEGGVEISYLADIPSELHGLGSVAAFTVGTLNALYQFVGHNPSSRQLSEDAEGILNGLGRTVYAGDTDIVSYGGFRHIQIGTDVVAGPSCVKLEQRVAVDLNNYILLFISENPQSEDIKHSSVVSGGSAVIASTLVNALERGEIAEVGELLHEVWERGENSSQRSELDELYLDSREAGALGGKILRDPEGGVSILLFVPFEKRAKVRGVLTSFREIPFKLERCGSRVVLNVRR